MAFVDGLATLALSGFLMYMCVCPAAGYREIVIQSLPQISALDGLDRLGNPSQLGLGSPCDIPGLEDYVDLLLSSDTSHNEAVVFDPILPLVALYLYHYISLY